MVWLACIWMLINFFQTWYHDRHDKSLHFGTSVNDLDFYAKPQKGFEKARTCSVILL